MLGGNSLDKQIISSLQFFYVVILGGNLSGKRYPVHTFGSTAKPFVIVLLKIALWHQNGILHLGCLHQLPFRILGKAEIPQFIS